MAGRLPAVHQCACVQERPTTTGRSTSAALRWSISARSGCRSPPPRCFPNALRWVGLGWIGLTLVNAVTHIVTSIRFRCYNPGLVTSIVLFLPFTIWMLRTSLRAGAVGRARSP